MPFNIPVKFMNLTFLTGSGSAGLAWLAYACRDSLPLPLKLALWHTAASGFLVSLASTEWLATRSAGMFGKRPDGHIPWLRWALFWPFHSAVRVVVAVYRSLSSEPLYTKIEDGLYLGGCPSRPSDLPPGPAPALLDVTCEMPRCVGAASYKVLPSWETHGLEPEQIQEGVEWAQRQRSLGRPVLTYCTHGHGRSAVLACALMIAFGHAAGLEEARRMVTRARPGAKPNRRQWHALDRWFAQFGHRAAAASKQE